MQNKFEKVLDFRKRFHGISKVGQKPSKTEEEQILNILNSLKNDFLPLFRIYNNIPFTIEYSKGIGAFPFVLHISILPPQQKVSDGVYTVLCFDIKGRGIVVGCAQSVTHSKGLKTTNRDGDKSFILNVNGPKKDTRYNNCFLNPKEFYSGNIDIESITDHIYKSMRKSLEFLNLYTSENEDIDRKSYIPAQKEENSREKALRAISIRKGQGKFRKTLLKAYDNKCAITCCEIVDIIDAAHIEPYNGEDSNNIQNGILLRTDIHTLFDLGLITIDADTLHVKVHRSLEGTDYFVKYNDKKVHLPTNEIDKPSKEVLQYHQTQVFKK